MKRLKLIVGMALAAVALLALHVAPAAAGGAGTAVVEFETDATLSSFPGTGTTNLDNGTVNNAVGAGVTHDGTPAAAHDTSGTITNPNPINYQEPLGCEAGLADGDDVEVDTPSTFATIDFDWRRVGPAAVIVLDDVDATYKSAPTNGGFISNGVGAGVATFEVTDPDLVSACTEGPQEITVHVHGVAAVAGAH